MLRLSSKHKYFRSPDEAKIDPAEYAIAEEKLFQFSQFQSFPAKFKQLAAEKHVKALSCISSHSLFIAPNGLIKSTGHIQRLSATTFETRHPIFLDSRHRLIQLFLHFYHIKHKHHSVDYPVSVIHQHFFWLEICTKSFGTLCVCCRKRKAKTVTTMMSEFCAELLGYRQPPFSNCGIDYFEPFQLTSRRFSEKR